MLAGITRVSAYARTWESPRAVSTVDLLPGDEVQHVKPPLRLDGDLVVEVEPVDGEEELVELTESELGESRACSFHDRLLDEVSPNRVAAAGPVEVREGMSEMDGSQLALEIPPQPVVEPQRVQVRSGADLEHDIP